MMSCTSVDGRRETPAGMVGREEERVHKHMCYIHVLYTCVHM